MYRANAIISQVLVLQVNVVILSRLPCNGHWLNGLRNARKSQSMNTTRPAMDELAATALRIGLLSFGGPVATIALMHRILVDEKKWLGEKQFLHGLNFCMLLPGPEAMQLATYSGWLVRGIGGGLVAGLLFTCRGHLSCWRYPPPTPHMAISRFLPVSFSASRLQCWPLWFRL
ncbi:MAG: chromate transporter [Nitratireductor sp.]